MKITHFRSLLTQLLSFAVLYLCAMPLSNAQQPTAVVPTLIRFSGTLTDVGGKPLTGFVGVTFSLYKDEQGGAPLWMETQNVQPDKSGRYAVSLGATTSKGLPTDVFVSGEARWLGVQPEGQAEQPRVLLLSVPYALKAGDAETIGGLSPSAFVLAAPAGTASTNVRSDASTTSSSVQAPTTSNVTTTGGTANTIPLFTTATNIQNSLLTQTGTTAINVGGKLNLPALGTATATKGFNSQPHNFVASVFNSGTATAVAQTFQLQAEPLNNDKSTASGTLNLLYGSGTATPTETGLKISNKGLITFATGQTFPGTGTITGVTAGTDLTGGGKSGTVTLNLDTTKVPQLKAANTFSGNQSVTGNLSATGSFTGQTASFSASNNTQVVNVTQSGSGSAISASSPGNAAIFRSATGFGIEGQSAGVGGIGVYGAATTTSSSGAMGVYGSSSAPNGAGVLGSSLDTTTAGVGVGVEGFSASPKGFGLFAYETGNSGIGAYGQWQSASSIGAGFIEIGVWGDSSNGDGVIGSSDTRNGVLGISTFGTGAEGVSHSSAGVFGESDNDIGMYGLSGASSAVGGVNGIHFTNSNTGAGFTTFGVWGDTGVSGGIGVVGTADDGNSLFGKNNTVNHETLYVENDSGFSNGLTPYAARFAGPGASTYCYIPRDSNDNGTGDLVCTGSKSAAVAVDGNRMVRLYAVEAADNWFEDAGSGHLSNGSAAIRFESAFSQTVNPSVEYHIFLTPKGDCEGLYVSHEGPDGFEVHELRGGKSNIAFDYRIMARRKGFENVRMQDVTQDFAHMKQESDLLAARLEARKQEEKAHPRMAIPAMPKRAPSSSPNSTQKPVRPVSATPLAGLVK